MMNLGPEYPEILSELAEHIRECLVESGMDKQPATKLALKVVERVRLNFGGQVVYIPFGLSHEALKRWEEIWTKFNGTNQPRLAKEYDCSEVHINRVLRRMREVKMREVQRDLPLTVVPEKHSPKT